MELKQELKLKQTLSQKMIQSANILQMGQIELKEYIEEMALENPVVDLEVQIFTSKQQRRTSRTDMYCFGTALIQEFGCFAELGAADDGIVD